MCTFITHLWGAIKLNNSMTICAAFISLHSTSFRYTLASSYYSNNNCNNINATIKANTINIYNLNHLSSLQTILFSNQFLLTIAMLPRLIIMKVNKNEYKHQLIDDWSAFYFSSNFRNFLIQRKRPRKNLIFLFTSVSWWIQPIDTFFLSCWVYVTLHQNQSRQLQNKSVLFSLLFLFSPREKKKLYSISSQNWKLSGKHGAKEISVSISFNKRISWKKNFFYSKINIFQQKQWKIPRNYIFWWIILFMTFEFALFFSKYFNNSNVFCIYLLIISKFIHIFEILSIKSSSINQK